MKNLKKIVTKDRDLSKVQDNFQEFTLPLINNPLLNGVLIEDIYLASGANNVSHKLGRAPQGWIIIRKSANVGVWEDPTLEYLPETILNISVSGDVTISLYVF